MTAQRINGQAPGGKRTRLADVLPLETPFVIQIFPVYACNFTCKYCIFSMEKGKRGFISDQVVMDLDLFRKCIDGIAQFPQKVKVLRFVGIGEPLLHKDLVEMVRYAAVKKVAQTVELLTNASLLTPALSDQLVTAGLSRLVVSLQGTTAKKYEEVCGVKLDLEGFIRNLRYFFRHKGKTQVYIKVIDCALDGKDDEKRFYDLFGNICDTMAIEHAVPIHAGIDYKGVLKPGQAVTQFGLPVGDVQICPQPFFTMQINPDGKVVPCYSFEYPGIMGDCRTQSVRDIWNGEVFRKFRRDMLDGVRHAGETCAACQIIRHRFFPEDQLNEAAPRLKGVYAL